MMIGHCLKLPPEATVAKGWPEKVLSTSLVPSTYIFLRFYLFILDRGEGREKDKERNINVWLPLVHPLLGTWSGLQPRHVPWLGIKMATLGFADRCSIHWDTPSRAKIFILEVPWVIVILTQPALGIAAVYNREPSGAFEQDRNMISPIFLKNSSGDRMNEWKVTHRQGD